ncbi:MAG: hypothetical protein ABUK20_09370 [Anaerolineales bacterium]
MKKLMYVLLLVSLLAVIPVAALANEGKPSMERLEDRGWTCDPLGEWHCFNPAFGKSKNTSSITVNVFELDGKFLGTEVLWSVDTYAGQPCPQDEILTPADLDGLPYYACHHYSH